MESVVDGIEEPKQENNDQPPSRGIYDQSNLSTVERSHDNHRSVITDDAPILTKDYLPDIDSYSRAMAPVQLREAMPKFAFMSFLWLSGCYIFSGLIFTLIAMAVLIVFVLLAVMMKPLHIRKQLEHTVNQQLLDTERSFRFTESAVTMFTPNLGENRVSWKLLSRIVVSRDWTLLFQSYGASMAVPDSAFKSREDLEAFRALIARKAAGKGNR